jgi:4-amino-4-deoxy-L-arabinose transferase-like glycosyltransferase
MRVRAPRGRWLAVLLPLLAGGAALAVSWERWIDPFVDSGREMDVPWRLALGERLYRDITYYYGPLGPWLNALALRLFGHRWLVLEGICLLLAIAILALVYQLARQAGSRWSAIAAVTLSAAFCLGAPKGGAFIFPYSSSCLLALGGGLLALWAACLQRRRPALTALAAAGLAVALAARLEVGAAAAVTLLLAGGRSRPRRETWRESLAVVAAASLLAGSLYAVALWGLEWREIRHDGPLTHLAGMPPEWRKLYLEVAGLDRPARNGRQVLLGLAIDAALVALLAGFALPAPEPARRRRFLFPVLGLALLVAYLLSPFADPTKNLPPLTLALPLLALAAAAAVWLRRPLAGQDRARFLLFGFSAVVASRVLLSLPLGPRMGPYAALPLPGLLATAAVLAFDQLAPRLPDPAAFRRRLAALLAAVAVIFLYRLHRADQWPPTTELRTSSGVLRLPSPEAQALDHALRYLAAEGRAGDRLIAFPESGFFNFVTSMRSPLRQDQVFPGVLSGEREREAARLIARAGPRFILLCYRPTPEYGPQSFGADYDVALWREIERRYRWAASFEWTLGGAPAGRSRSFIRLYERLAAPEGPPPLRLAAGGDRRPYGGQGCANSSSGCAASLRPEGSIGSSM